MRTFLYFFLTLCISVTHGWSRSKEGNGRKTAAAVKGLTPEAGEG